MEKLLGKLAKPKSGPWETPGSKSKNVDTGVLREENRRKGERYFGETGA